MKKEIQLRHGGGRRPLAGTEQGVASRATTPGSSPTASGPGRGRGGPTGSCRGSRARRATWRSTCCRPGTGSCSRRCSGHVVVRPARSTRAYTYTATPGSLHGKSWTMQIGRPTSTTRSTRSPTTAASATPGSCRPSPDELLSLKIDLETSPGKAPAPRRPGRARPTGRPRRGRAPTTPSCCPSSAARSLIDGNAGRSSPTCRSRWTTG